MESERNKWEEIQMFCTETSILESPVPFILEFIIRIGLIVQCVQLVSNLVLNIILQTVYLGVFRVIH